MAGQRRHSALKAMHSCRLASISDPAERRRLLPPELLAALHGLPGVQLALSLLAAQRMQDNARGCTCLLNDKEAMQR